MGRPRKFDQKDVADKIMQVFWEKGYARTSLEDIVKVTGLKKGSLYSSFGNKEDMFRLAIQNYLKQGAAALPKTESAVATLCRFYSYIIDEAADKKKRDGCLIFNSCLEFSNQKGPLGKFVLEVGRQREAFFQGLLKEARAKKEIPARIDARSAGVRAFATAFAIRELSKFKPERSFLADIANTYLSSIGSARRV